MTIKLTMYSFKKRTLTSNKRYALYAWSHDTDLLSKQLKEEIRSDLTVMLSKQGYDCGKTRTRVSVLTSHPGMLSIAVEFADEDAIVLKLKGERGILSLTDDVEEILNTTIGKYYQHDKI